MNILITRKDNSQMISCFSEGETKAAYFDYVVCAKDSNDYDLFEKRIDDTVYLIWGSLYAESKTAICSYIIDLYLSNNYEKIFEQDGEFFFVALAKDHIDFFSDREGVIPVFYRYGNEYGLSISTDCYLLFYDYCVDNIDLCSVNDYLRFGTLIGDRTMHKEVKLIQGGSVARFDLSGHAEVRRLYKFVYGAPNRDYEELEYNIISAYQNAIRKRIAGREKKTCIFLSGGMDSRFLLAEANAVTEHRIKAYSFGQTGSEEVGVARAVAALKGNPFEWIPANASDFADREKVAEYERMTCGADMFPQSYIIEAAKKIKESHFLTGFALDAYMGGTFLDSEILSSRKPFSEDIDMKLKKLKMQCLSNELLNFIKKESINLFELGIGDVLLEAKKYDEYAAADAIQPFAIDNRAKRLVLCRELVPAKEMDYSCVSADLNFLKACSSIPADQRLDHKFYQELFRKKLPDYAKIVYNNTTLPITAPVELWKQGEANESGREQLYERFLAEYNSKHDDKMYYTHFYSDFNGYSRYDPVWKQLFEEYLFSGDCIICDLWFEKMRIKELYDLHLLGKANNRRALIYLTSLEIFLRNAL